MDDLEKEVLKQCLDVIKDVDLDEESVMKMELAKIILSKHRQDINNTKNHKKTIKLIDILQKRGPQAFTKFVAFLEEDYKWVAEKLRQELHKVKEEHTTKLKQSITLLHYHLFSMLYGEVEPKVKPDDLNELGIITKYLMILKRECCWALEIPLKTAKKSLPQLIEDKVKLLKTSISTLSNTSEYDKERLVKRMRQSQHRENERDQQYQSLQNEILRLKQENIKLKQSLDNLHKEKDKEKDKKIKDNRRQIQNLQNENAKLKTTLKEITKQYEDELQKRDLQKNSVTIQQMYQRSDLGH